MRKSRTVTTPEPVDPETYASHIDTALRAFASDVSYAVLIARSAVNLGRKRKIITHELARI